MELEWETTVEGPSVDRLIGLQNVRATLALMRTPDGLGRIELDKFHTPEAIRTGPENVPVNALGIRRIMFAVDDLDGLVARLLAHPAIDLLRRIARIDREACDPLCIDGVLIEPKAKRVLRDA